jgi:hypothetical protein
MMCYLHNKTWEELFTLRTLLSLIFHHEPCKALSSQAIGIVYLEPFGVVYTVKHLRCFSTKYKVGWKVVMGGTCCLRVRDDKFIGYKV